MQTSNKLKENGEKELLCIFCNKLFERWYYLKCHLEQHVIDARKLIALTNCEEIKSRNFHSNCFDLLDSRNENSVNSFHKKIVKLSSYKSSEGSDGNNKAYTDNFQLRLSKQTGFDQNYLDELSSDEKNESHQLSMFINRNGNELTVNANCINVISLDYTDSISSQSCNSKLVEKELNNSGFDNAIQQAMEHEVDDPSAIVSLSLNDESLQANQDFIPIDQTGVARESEAKVLSSEEKLDGLHLTDSTSTQENQSGGNENICPVCRKGFRTKTTLSVHMKLHSGLRPYSCSICDKSFTRKGTLETHLRYHSGERRFICEVCGAGFFTSHSLARHLKLHSGERSFSCSECDSSYVTVTDLKRHKLSHNKVKPHACHLCTKAFSRKHDLKVHLRYHNGVMPYKCQYCGKCFVEESNYKRHLRHHTGEKPYSCSLCNINFSQLHHIKKHQKTCHPDENAVRAALINGRATLARPQKLNRRGHLQKISDQQKRIPSKNI